MLEKLTAIPGDPEVVIFDDKRNEAEDDGTGSSAGIYEEFSVDNFTKDDVTEDSPPFVGLTFKNKYFPETDK